MVCQAVPLPGTGVFQTLAPFPLPSPHQDTPSYTQQMADAMCVNEYLLTSLLFTFQRLCPLLNGTMKADNGAAEHGGFGNYNAPTMSAGSPAA